MRKLKNVGAGLVYARGKRGITLVALIITIIVMLILVGVSVQVLINSNLIGTAQDAANRMETAYEEEGSTGEITVGDKTYESLDDYLASKENGGGGSLPTVTVGQRATSNSEYSDGTKTAVIPKGFTVSGVKTSTVDETTIDGGLVIYLIPEGTTIDWTDGTAVANAQKTYDQFVWIPIKNTTDANAQDINDMYICQGKTADNGACTITVENGVAKCTNTNHSSIVEGTEINKNNLMAGRLYAKSIEENFEQGYTETYTSGSGLREPDTVSSYDGNSTCLGYLSSILEPDVAEANKEYTSINNFKEKLQKEYNEVVKSVYENQGFYVGRYETSGMAQSETSYDVAVVAGTLPSGGIDWYHMYAQQKNYAKANSLTVGSTMIQGAAYDQVMKFVNTATYSVTTAGNVGHSTEQGAGSRYQTGGLNYNAKTDAMTDYKEYKDLSKNIFDLEGNVRAWTTEAYSTNGRVYRGGNYYLSNSASYRYTYAPYPTRTIRIQLRRHFRFVGPALRKIEYFT